MPQGHSHETTELKLLFLNEQCAPKSPDQSALLGSAQGRVKQNAKHQLQLSGTLWQDSMDGCVPIMLTVKVINILQES